MFESVSNFLSDSWGAVKNAASGAADTFGNSVDDLKAKAAEFMALFGKLKAIQQSASLSPSEKARVDAIVKRGEVVKASVSTITKGIDGIANILPKSMLAGVVRSGGLGIVPLIPVAVISAAVAALGVWIADAKVELEKLEMAEKVRLSGGDPASILGGGNKINMVVLGGAALTVIAVVYLMSRDRKKGARN